MDEQLNTRIILLNEKIQQLEAEKDKLTHVLYLILQGDDGFETDTREDLIDFCNFVFKECRKALKKE
jgi:predicted nuclease of restriction endonuclease-like RecB superfamily